MGEPVFSDESTLAEALKRDAQATRPAFSESLHARVCRSVQTLRQGRPMARPRRSPLGRQRWLYLAVTASLLVGVSVAVWRGLDAPESTVDPLDRFGTLADVVDLTAAEMGTEVETRLSDQRWAHLDHDFQVATELLIDKLPLNMLASAVNQ